jgi:hypothetical protein
MEIKLNPISIVKNSRTTPTDDYWEEVISEIELADHIPAEAFERISDFSHLEIIYFFNKADNKEIVYPGRPFYINKPATVMHYANSIAAITVSFIVIVSLIMHVIINNDFTYKTILIWVITGYEHY